MLDGEGGRPQARTRSHPVLRRTEEGLEEGGRKGREDGDGEKRKNGKSQNINILGGVKAGAYSRIRGGRSRGIAVRVWASCPSRSFEEWLLEEKLSWPVRDVLRRLL